MLNFQIPIKSQITQTSTQIPYQICKKKKKIIVKIKLICIPHTKNNKTKKIILIIDQYTARPPQSQADK